MKSTKEKIITILKEKDIASSQQVAGLLKISRQAAHRQLDQLVNTGQIIKIGRTRGTRYALPSKLSNHSEINIKLNNKNIAEYEVLENIFAQLPVLRTQPENVQSIFRYAFSEMLNNAIEHSKSKRITVKVGIVDGLLVFEVRDFGIGVFRSVCKKFKLKQESDAIGELLKGKATSVPKAHSGEGIFFTSKIADTFMLQSFGWELLVINTIPDVFMRPLKRSVSGTSVHFTIALDAKQHLIDLFEKFTVADDDHEFKKTRIMVKLFTYGTVHISRSQARRILEHLPERFSKIVLDFDQVPSIGQAFADEIFRVFKKAHPEVKIEVANANESVDFMIKHVAK